MSAQVSAGLRRIWELVVKLPGEFSEAGMPCAVCGDIIPTEIGRCPGCGAWARRRNFRALALSVFLLLGFNAFMALGSGIGLARMFGPLTVTTSDSYDPRATTKVLTAYADVFAVTGALAVLTGASTGSARPPSSPRGGSAC